MQKTFLQNCPYYLLSPFKKLYGFIPKETRLGKCFREQYRFLQKTREWSYSERKQYQLCELQSILRHAYEHVPYYRRIFDDRKLRPEDFHTLSDLAMLPFLTRDIIRENLHDLLAINIRSSDMHYKITGGTTGVPMGFYDQKSISEDREWAFIATLWQDIGYDITKPNRSVILRGVLPAKGHFEYKGLGMVLSSYQLHDEKMFDYVQRIKNFKPDFIQAYPSSVGILANFMLKNKLDTDINNLKAVICTSEVLSDFTRKQIEAAFHTRVYSFYGHSERSCLAGGCEESSNYHLVGEYGYTEIVDASGNTIQGDHIAGEIVCTGFNNYAMPFIRYRTGDIGIRTSAQCRCGRNTESLQNIKGRVQDYLIDKNNEPMNFINSDIALWHIKDKIHAYQYVQDIPGRVRLDIEPCENLSVLEMRMIEEEFVKWFPGIDAELRTVQYITRTASGKFRYLVQNIPQAGSYTLRA